MVGLLMLLGFAAAIITVVGSAGTIHRLRHPRRRGFGWALGRGLPTEPSEAGLEGREVTLRLSDGQTSPGWLMRGLAREPGSPVIVLTHGWGESRFDLLPRAARLAPVASALLAYDLRAHGDSTAPRSDLGTTEVEDLRAILDQIDAPGPIVLAGYSIGAGISIAAAARGPLATGQRPVHGVVGDGAYCHGMDPIVGYFRAQRWPAYPFLWVVAAYLHHFVQKHDDFDRARHAARLACPLLLLHGSDDEVCTLASARNIASGLPHARLVEFAGGAHLDLPEIDGGRYDQIVHAFVRDASRTPPRKLAPPPASAHAPHDVRPAPSGAHPASPPTPAAGEAAT